MTEQGKERLKSIKLREFLRHKFFRAIKEVSELREAYLDMDGHLDAYEVELFAKGAKISNIDVIMEIFSTHPNVVKRISWLSYQNAPAGI